MYILSVIFLGVSLDFPRVDLSSCKCINPYFALFLKMEELKHIKFTQIVGRHKKEKKD